MKDEMSRDTKESKRAKNLELFALLINCYSIVMMDDFVNDFNQL